MQNFPKHCWEGILIWNTNQNVKWAQWESLPASCLEADIESLVRGDWLGLGGYYQPQDKAPVKIESTTHLLQFCLSYEMY